VSLFESGGLQRDCTGVAQRLISRGHDVTIVCSEAEAEPPDVKLILLPNSAFFNHNHNLQFSRDFARLADDFDVVVGFNKLPHLDVLYCADPVSRQPSTMLQRFNPRIRGYIRLDLTCFGASSATRLLLLSEAQWDLYRKTYRTDSARAEILPPTVERSRAISLSDQPAVRAAKRKELGISAESKVWLFVASYPAAKGLDRIIGAMRAMPDILCLCVGFDLAERRHHKLLNLAESADVLSRLIQLGRRSDIPELMSASDLLVHPSRKDVTGTVILEALINGLPIITTKACGYSSHVSRANAGVVVASDPFSLLEFESAIAKSFDKTTLDAWRRDALSYVSREDIFSGLDRAASAIEEAGERKMRTPQFSSK